MSIDREHRPLNGREGEDAVVNPAGADGENPEAGGQAELGRPDEPQIRQLAGQTAVAGAGNGEYNNGVGNEPAPLPFPRPERVGLLGTRGRKIAAGVTAGILGVCALGTGAAVGVDHWANKHLSAAVPLNPDDESTAEPTPSITSAVPLGGAPLTLGSTPDEPGNFILSQRVPGMHEFEVPWPDGSHESVRRIIPPHHSLPLMPEHDFTETETAAGFLDQYAYLLSTDPADSMYQQIMNDFTDNGGVRTFVLSQNAQLRSLYGQNGAQFQVTFFDTQTVPAVADEGGFQTYDSAGDQLPSIKFPSDGELHMRVLGKACRVDYDAGKCTTDPKNQLARREDGAGDIPGEASDISGRFVYKVTPEGDDGTLEARVEGIDLTVQNNNWFPVSGTTPGLVVVN